jgi:uncharacterized protein (DUF2384 family)
LSLPFDQIVLYAVTSAMAGAALAWYVPDAAAAARYDPLAEAREERVRMLEAAAFERLKDRAEATKWLGRPHPALGDKSPKAAAAEVEGYEHAIGLLQGPKPMAVA